MSPYSTPGENDSPALGKGEHLDFPWPAEQAVPVLLSFLNSGSSIVFVKDSAGRYVYVNRQFLKCFEYEPKAVIGKTDHDLFPEEVAERHLRNDAYVRSTGEMLHTTTTLPSKNGTTREYSSQKFCFTDGVGEVYIGGVSIDISEQRRAQRMVAASQARLKAAVEGGLDAFFVLEAVRDADNNIEDFVFVDINGRAEKLLSLARWEVVGHKLCELLPINRTAGFFDRYVRVVESGVPIEEEFPIDTPEIRAQWLRHQVVPLGDGIAITTRDITDQKAAEAMAQEHTQLLENALDGISIHDENGRFTYVNGPMAQFLGRSVDQILEMDWEGICHPADIPERRRQYEMMQVEGRVDTELRAVRPDGEDLYLRVVIIPMVRDGQFRGHYTFAANITEKRQYEARLEEQNRLLSEAKAELTKANERLRQLAATDGLTGLGNHREFQTRLEAELQRADRYGHDVSLLMMDVDHFKQYNDSFGHPAGDEVLRTVAELLRQEARESDFVARYGGEEFAVILPMTGPADAAQMAERVRARIEWHGWPLRAVTVSVGLASRSLPLATSEALLKAADQALYASKQAGRNRVSVAL